MYAVNIDIDCLENLVSLVDFLLECLCDEMSSSPTDKEIAEIQFNRKIIELTQSWPVLLQGPIELNPKVAVESLSTVVYEMTSRYQFVLASEYKKIFGEDAPTSPLLLQMAQIYSDHPNFNPEWKLKEN